ncbi:MAG: phosphoribosylformylglycinamidine cyclo-ligase [Verrucomicrobiae bacterium]|nr:phosphoribosylformylglycinamidine cyclo-ligase [Verrucomicrobiae bacterium]
MKKKAYAEAGVDIDLANKAKSKLPELLAITRRKGVLGKVGGFGGLFELDLNKYENPVLVSSVDGVGTKLKIAFAMNRHDTVGQDLVNHCVNDIAVLGAEPLFFLDYIGTGKLEEGVFQNIIKGLAMACSENNCALIGGETAQMPGFYQEGEYDISGTIVGVVEKTKILSGKTIKPGDAIIGIASTGLHTNGYSLARKIFFDQMRLKPESKIPELENTVGEELLKIHVSYLDAIQKLIRKFNKEDNNVIKAFAHITGGGFIDNIPRVIPKNCNALIRKNTWEVLPIFKALQKYGNIEDAEIYQVFNMGIGMTAIVSADKADSVLKLIKSTNHKAWIIGEIIKGKGETVVQ